MTSEFCLQSKGTSNNDVRRFLRCFDPPNPILSNCSSCPYLMMSGFYPQIVYFIRFPKFATFFPFLTEKSYIYAKVPVQGLRFGYFMGQRKYTVHIGVQVNLFQKVATSAEHLMYQNCSAGILSLQFS